MSNKNNKIINWILLTIIIILTLFSLPFDKVKTSALKFFDNIDNFITNIATDFSLTKNTSADHHISNISFTEDNDNYFAVLTFRSINIKNITSITINNIEFYANDFIYDDNEKLTINISDIVSSNNSTIIKITSIKTSSKNHLSTLETTFYKSVNYEIIEQRKKSLVGVASRGSRFAHNPTNKWGSGIILTQNEVTKSGLFNDFTMYEYIIITNSHVVDKGDYFFIYYNDENDEYPKSTKFFEPTETVELLGIYTTNTDLAILKLTTFNGSLTPLNDEQFISQEATDIAVGDRVFLIGSPFINNTTLFNSYKIGYIKDTLKTISLANTDICSDGCYSIKSTAYLGEGSSGGALFDIDGNLIGVNFAGSEEYEEAFAIPIWQVFKALDEILGVNYIKRSQTTSFFMLPHIRHLQLFF